MEAHGGRIIAFTITHFIVERMHGTRLYLRSVEDTFKINFS